MVRPPPRFTELFGFGILGAVTCAESGALFFRSESEHRLVFDMSAENAFQAALAADGWRRKHRRSPQTFVSSPLVSRRRVEHEPATETVVSEQVVSDVTVDVSLSSTAVGQAGERTPVKEVATTPPVKPSSEPSGEQSEMEEGVADAAEQNAATGESPREERDHHAADSSLSPTASSLVGSIVETQRATQDDETPPPCTQDSEPTLLPQCTNTHVRIDGVEVRCEGTTNGSSQLCHFCARNLW